MIALVLAAPTKFTHGPVLMSEMADFTVASGEAGNTLVFSGPMTVGTIGALDHRLRELDLRPNDPPDQHIANIDLGAVSQLDTVGAWTALRLSRRFGAQIINPGDAASRLIDALDHIDDGTPVPENQRLRVWLRVPEQIGDTVIGLSLGAVQVLGFLGQMILASGSLVRHPGRFRGMALVHQMELVGVNALGIIGLMSFLVGIVIAQQGAEQLRQFGAEIYTINLVGRLSMRELGILMTAIMVAGRSGSAFAAEIGTMKLTEEVDAMRTIGVSPMEALVLPRVIATVVMMPLLGIYAAAMSIIGGAFLASLTLGIPFLNFLSRIRDVVPVHDVGVGLCKGPVFGLIVALAGCYQGMQVRNNAEEVGQRTTAAVVMAIFTVIVLDAFFAVFFTQVGWG